MSVHLRVTQAEGLERWRNTFPSSSANPLHFCTDCTRVRVIRGLTPSICRIHQRRNRTLSLFVFDLKIPLGDQKTNTKFNLMEVDLKKKTQIQLLSQKQGPIHELPEKC